MLVSPMKSMEQFDQSSWAPSALSFGVSYSDTRIYLPTGRSLGLKNRAKKVKQTD